MNPFIIPVVNRCTSRQENQGIITEPKRISSKPSVQYLKVLRRYHHGMRRPIMRIIKEKSHPDTSHQ